VGDCFVCDFVCLCECEVGCVDWVVVVDDEYIGVVFEI